MKKSTHCLVVVAVVGVASTALADNEDSCAALLVHGIYDQSREYSESQAATLIDRQICDTYNRYTRDVIAGNVQLSYGIFGGSVSLNKESIEAIGKVMCSRDFSKSASENLVARASSMLNATAVAAWKSCMDAREKRGLQATWRFREEDQRFASLEVEYVPPPGGRDSIKVDRVVISPANGMICSGALKEIAGKSIAATKRYSLACDRPIYNAPKKHGPLGDVWAPPASIQLDTEAGQVRADWRAIRPASPPPVSVLPVGTIIPFLGRMASASATPPGWLLCNGDEVKISQYPELHTILGGSYGKPTAPDSFKLPNLQGMFLRGFDPMGSIDKEGAARTMPDGRTGNSIGSTQDYATALPRKKDFVAKSAGEHTHGLELETTAGREDGDVNNTAAYPFTGARRITTNASGAHEHTIVGGDTETRPANIAVYYLIKATPEALAPAKVVLPKVSIEGVP